ncbi:MAG: lipopolysaccharide biosynthesis protein [Candidatus Omnitrophica bacterium]|nr:lipopolysaccharide biosynthesis protein [Candidatus Omnitrophota bacterium]
MVKNNGALGKDPGHEHEVEGSLGRRVVKGGIWVFTLNLVIKGLGFVRTVILARLLLPSDFGLLGIAMIAVSMLRTLTGTGFAHALIQKKGGISDYMNTAWCVEAGRGTVLAVLLFLFAPVIAVFFKNPEAAGIMRVVAITVFLTGLVSTGIVHFEKQLKFEKLFIYNLGTQTVSLVVGVSLAFLLRNVWALVYGGIAGAVTKIVLSYALHPFRPALKFDPEKAKELFSFGKWVFISGILVFLITQGDDIFVGKLLGVTALGFYTMAYRLSNLPATEITHVLKQVTFPAYSKLQEDIPRLREACLKVLQVTAFLSFPVAGLIFILAPDFTDIFLGRKWMPMVPALRVLCVFGITRAIGAAMVQVLYGVGKPGIQTKLSGIQLIAMAVIIYPLSVRWGILGTSLAVVLPNMLSMVLVIKEVRHIMKISYKEFFMSIIAPALAVLSASWTVFLDVSGIYGFLLKAVLYCVICFAVVYIWDRRTGCGMFRRISEIIANPAGK